MIAGSLRFPAIASWANVKLQNLKHFSADFGKLIVELLIIILDASSK